MLVDRNSNEHFDDVAFYEVNDYTDYKVLQYGMFAVIRVYFSGLVEWL